MIMRVRLMLTVQNRVREVMEIPIELDIHNVEKDTPEWRKEILYILRCGELAARFMGAVEGNYIFVTGYTDMGDIYLGRRIVNIPIYSSKVGKEESEEICLLELANYVHDEKFNRMLEYERQVAQVPIDNLFNTR